MDLGARDSELSLASRELRRLALKIDARLLRKLLRLVRRPAAERLVNIDQR
jgi:hypothetical protein